jgi:hypothetical protein
VKVPNGQHVTTPQCDTPRPTAVHYRVVDPTGTVVEDGLETMDDAYDLGTGCEGPGYRIEVLLDTGTLVDLGPADPFEGLS